MDTSSTLQSLDLQKIISDLFIILSDKEKTVITKRFALDNKPKQTLEKIGQNFLVTRERVRQIEASALKKLKRNIYNTKLKLVNASAHEILDAHGGLLSEKNLISKILTKIFHTSAIDSSIVRLALTVDDKISKVESPRDFHVFWKKEDISKEDIKKIANSAYKALKNAGDIVSEKTLLSNLGLKNIAPETIISILDIDIRMKKVDKKWGLMEWRHINPKSIRDKIGIVLNQKGKPLHFVEISNLIQNAGFDKKTVTVQAVHNDLIRYDEFILVGRGLYGLKDWGLEEGTVADVIANILKGHGSISKKEIVKKVLAQRDVKIGTISLNLQKNDAFVRVGRAVYEFDQSAWKPAKSGRGRKSK